MRNISNIRLQRLTSMAHAPTCIFSVRDLAKDASKRDKRFSLSTVTRDCEECPDKGVNRDRQNAKNNNAKTHKNHKAKTHKNHKANTHKT